MFQAIPNVKPLADEAWAKPEFHKGDLLNLARNGCSKKDQHYDRIFVGAEVKQADFDRLRKLLNVKGILIVSYQDFCCVAADSCLCCRRRVVLAATKCWRSVCALQRPRFRPRR